MAYDIHLEDRISNILNEKRIHFTAKKMMGGLCYMINDKMCIGIIKNNLMARIGPEYYPNALQKEYVSEMLFTGKPMNGYVYVSPEGIDLHKDLEYWVQKCLDFNPQAKSSKKK